MVVVVAGADLEVVIENEGLDFVDVGPSTANSERTFSVLADSTYEKDLRVDDVTAPTDFVFSVVILGDDVDGSSHCPSVLHPIAAR